MSLKWWIVVAVLMLVAVVGIFIFWDSIAPRDKSFVPIFSSLIIGGPTLVIAWRVYLFQLQSQPNPIILEQYKRKYDAYDKLWVSFMAIDIYHDDISSENYRNFQMALGHAMPFVSKELHDMLLQYQIDCLRQLTDSSDNAADAIDRRSELANKFVNCLKYELKLSGATAHVDKLFEMMYAPAKK